MIDSFLKNFQASREHWVFWPFTLLLIQIGLYNFLFSKNGYLSYIEKNHEREILRKQIENLNYNKTELIKKLAHVKNEEEALKDFITRLYRYDDKSVIVKFIDRQANQKEIKKTKVNLPLIQRLYILVSTILLSIVTGLFWKLHKRRISNEI